MCKRSNHLQRRRLCNALVNGRIRLVRRRDPRERNSCRACIRSKVVRREPKVAERSSFGGKQHSQTAQDGNGEPEHRRSAASSRPHTLPPWNSADVKTEGQQG
eukprot:3392222-Rhodomonas_salina.1